MNGNYVYPVIIEEDAGEFSATFVDFPELYISADNKEQLIEDAQTQLAMTIIDYLDRKVELPKSSISVQNACYIQVWLPYFRSLIKETYVKKNLTVPMWLAQLANEKNINYSAVLVKALKKELHIEE